MLLESSGVSDNLFNRFLVFQNLSINVDILAFNYGFISDAYGLFGFANPEIHPGVQPGKHPGALGSLLARGECVS